ncbi:MAG: VWA domain-containing protein [Blastocatellia bacterium]|nr:VWA domain-containing protein [Blastocatellia bacterium]
MKKLGALLFFISIYLLLPLTGHMQQSSNSSFGDEDEAVIKVTTSNINLPVSVLNEKGRFVTNLKQQNFQVYENNILQPIIEFHSQTDLPLNVALLMDTSTSVRNRLEFEKVSIKSFLGTVLQGKRDKVAFYTFDTAVQMREDFTNDLQKVLSTVDGLKVANGQTSFYDAVFKVCRDKMARANSRRKVIVVITDGADTNSTVTLQQTIDLAQKTETTVFGISTKGGAVFRVEGTPYLNADDKDLRKLCRETGGDVLFPSNPEELTRAFQVVTEFLRNQYLLVYEPTLTSDGKYHEIEVKIVGQKEKNLLALTRKGYLAK